MNKEWIAHENRALAHKRKAYPQKLLDIWKDFPANYYYVLPSSVVYIMRILQLSVKHDEPVDIIDIMKLHETLKSQRAYIHYTYDSDKTFYEDNCKMDKEQLDRFLDKLLESSAEYYSYLSNPDDNFDVFLDSPVVKMTGTIIVTDPNLFITTPLEKACGCFVLKNDTVTLLGCHYKQKTRHGFGGYDQDKKAVYEYATMLPTRVCVGTLEGILKTNPDFRRHLTKPHEYLAVKNFSGTIKVQIKPIAKISHEKTGMSYTTMIVGHGVNTQTNEPIDFEMEAPARSDAL